MANNSRVGRNKQTHCKRNHEFTLENVYQKNGRRNCRKCIKIRYEEWASRTIGDAQARRKYTKRKWDNNQFGGNRERVIQRDGERCVRCDITREQHKKTFLCDITVDHIDGMGRYALPEDKNNDMDNLQTLCIVCHGRKDRLRTLERKKEI